MSSRSGSSDDGGESSAPHPSNQSTFDEYQTRVQQVALKATKQAFILPFDIGYQRAANKQFSSDLDIVSARIMSLTDKLLRFSSDTHIRGKGRARIKEEEDLTQRYDTSVLDVVDHLYEIADSNIDDFTGSNKPAAIPINAPTRKSNEQTRGRVPKPKAYLDKGPLHHSLIHAADIPKPQLHFNTPVNTANDYGPWKPKIEIKYHASVPLDYIPEPNSESLDTQEDLRIAALHPYHYEITHLQYPDHIYNPPESPVKPTQSPFENTPFKFVSTVAELDDILAALKTVQEIAIDLEHNDLRSYYGLVCLMQISTREQDWVIDTLALRVELSVLGEVFADPKITKVLHGAYNDILWLQRDLGLYIVNMFDTYHASVRLGGFPRNDLGSLLRHFCEFDADKRYQLADWRIRPLPSEMLFYARSDTHFLLYIYDSLRNLLLRESRQQKSSDPNEALAQVLLESSQTSLRLYLRESYDLETGMGEVGWATLLRKSSTYLGRIAKNVFIALHAWRDKVARELDEGTEFIAENRQLLKVASMFRAQSSQRPHDEASLLLALAPPRPSPIVRDRVSELWEIVQNAVSQESEEGTEEQQSTSAPGAAPNKSHSMMGGISEISSSVPPNMTQHTTSFTIPDLWSALSAAEGRKDDLPVAVSSSMFGTAPSSLQSTGDTQPSITTFSSSLFGVATARSPFHVDNRANFVSIQQKIHSSLVVPTVSPVTARAEDAPPLGELPDPNSLVMPAEIPFVPAAQRTTINEGSKAAARNPNAGEKIVIPGRPKWKKKKKRKLADTGIESEPNPAAPDTEGAPEMIVNTERVTQPADQQATIVPFDYASAPNILDAGDDGPQPSYFRKQKSKGSKDTKPKKGRLGRKPTMKAGNVSVSFS
ncbi:ribonuclease H-like domain-containing protein [Cantharellus anzutake]|uniref:ribonuclease H-like domain-containing protein n=1 Tax=Cantharellus anzutake TaxID=1750568 RepID=UPI001908D252|nr:ribonuclease H-like domain-containing protein [Cantharellus anzutake]KAF8334683.1 ribonuclease H-like domain-containing protein [Cantharellus anzutake]